MPGTFWKRSKDEPSKIAYSVLTEKGLRTPCQCKKLLKVDLIFTIQQSGGVDNTDFQPAISSGSLTLYTYRFYYTVTVVDGDSEYTASVPCQTLLADAGTFQRTLYPAAGVWASLTFINAVDVEWQLEQVYSNQVVQAYFLVDWATETMSLPELADILSSLPTRFDEFNASFGEGYDEAETEATGVYTDLTPPPDTYGSGPVDVAIAFGSAETVFNPTSSSVIANVSRTVDRRFPTPTAVNTFLFVRYGYLALKITDFIFFASLILDFDANEINTSPGVGYDIVIAYKYSSPAANYAEIIVLPEVRVAIGEGSGVPGSDDWHPYSADLSSLLNHSGRDIYLYISGEIYYDQHIGAPPVQGDPDVTLNILKDLQVTPTFTYGPTSP